MSEITWMANNILTKLVGKTVTGVAVDEDGEFAALKFGDEVAWILRDPEGNGGRMDFY